MKILLIPLDFHRHLEDPSLFGDLIVAFRINHDARIFTTMEEAISFKPDVIFYQGSLTKEQCFKLKQQTGALWTTWTGDARYVPQKSLIECKDFTDQFYIPFSGKTMEAYYLLLGKPCAYIFEPLHNCRVMKPKELTEGDVSFVGNYYHWLPGGDERSELIHFFEHDNRIKFYGSLGQSISHSDVPKLYNDSLAVIAQNNYSDIDGYFTPRNLMAMANSLCLAKEFSGIESHFENWKHCIYYRSKYELLDIINYLRENPEIRSKIVKQGHELIKEKYTYTNWANLYIEKLL